MNDQKAQRLLSPLRLPIPPPRRYLIPYKLITRHIKNGPSRPSAREPLITGGGARNRTGDMGFAGPCLTTWPRRQFGQDEKVAGIQDAVNERTCALSQLESGDQKVPLLEVSLICYIHRCRVREPRHIRQFNQDCFFARSSPD